MPTNRSTTGWLTVRQRFHGQRERSALPSSNPWRLLPEGLRSTVAALALFCGLANFAGWRGRPLSWLEVLLRRFQCFSFVRCSSSANEKQYRRQLSGKPTKRL